MNNCAISFHFAYAMIIYILGSIYYLLRTRTIGTPFNDSLTDEQRKIKNESANRRRMVFYQGLLLSIVVVYVMPPLKACSCNS